jgi:hypothetical protein
MRLAVELIRAIVAVSDTLEQIINFEQFNDALTMGDVRVGEEPQADLACVNILDEFAQFRVRLDDFI